MADAQKLARIFKVLSVDTRVRMIELLRSRHPLCVNALARQLGITAAAASQHLRILRDADIAVAEKRGYHVHYRLNHEALAAWKALTEGFMSNLGNQDEGVEEEGGHECAGKKTRRSKGSASTRRS